MAYTGDWSSCERLNGVQGFASLGGGTTGGADVGAGNYRVSAVTGMQIKEALVNPAYADKPLSIYIDGLITWEDSNSSAINIRRNNVSLIGRGVNAGFEGAPVLISHGASNIIIRNLKMRLVPQAHSPGDIISLDGRNGAVSNIWIDHNELYNSLTAPPGVTCDQVPGCDGNVDQDYYDELVSGRSAVHNVTISYNYLHDSWKTSLWGSSDTVAEENVGRTISFHHNYWHNTRARLPLFRFGEGHVFNNYYFNVATSAVNSRMGAQMRVDGNVFENVIRPITSRDSSALGFWDVADNSFTNITPNTTVGNTACGASPPCDAYLLSTITYFPAYEYFIQPSGDVKDYVTTHAGADQLGSCLVLPDTTELPVAEEPEVEQPKDPPSAWNVYNADALPDAADSIDLAGASTASFTLGGTSANAPHFTTGAAGTVNFDTSAATGDTQHATLDNVVNNSGAYPKYFTWLAGVTGNSDNIRVLEIEVAMADDGETGRRVKTLLRADGGNQGVQLERTDCPALATTDGSCTSVQQYGMSMTGFRVWQVSITLTDATTGNVQVYGDGNDTPLLTLTGVTLRPTSSAGHNFLRFGDGGGNAYKSNIDWVIWTNENAYLPSELKGALPAGIGAITGYEAD
jgi:pectate lyase